MFCAHVICKEHTPTCMHAYMHKMHTNKCVIFLDECVSLIGLWHLISETFLRSVCSYSQFFSIFDPFYLSRLSLCFWATISTISHAVCNSTTLAITDHCACWLVALSKIKRMPAWVGKLWRSAKQEWTNIYKCSIVCTAIVKVSQTIQFTINYARQSVQNESVQCERGANEILFFFSLHCM